MKKNFFKNFAINIAIFLAIILVLFIIAEIVSRFAFTYTKEGPTAINMKIFKESEIYGWGHKPGAIDYHGYGDPTPEISINSLGFRDDEISPEKPENTKRILVLGDSFTFGMNIAHENIYTEVLEAKLNEQSEDTNYEVINAGSIGYTIDNQYLLLKEKGLQLEPDVVVVAFFAGNDVTELRRHEWITDENGNLERLIDTEHYVDDKHRLRYKGEDEPASYFINFIYKRWLILKKKLGLEGPGDKPTLTWPAFLEPDDPHGDPRLPQFWDQIETVLKVMKDDLDAQGIKLVVMVIPMDVQTHPRYWNKYSQMYFDEEAYEAMRPQKKMEELADKYNIELIDLLPYFLMVSNDTWYYFEDIDPHWTNEGHAFAAEILFNELEI